MRIISCITLALALNMTHCAPGESYRKSTNASESSMEGRVLARWDDDEHKDLRAVVVLHRGEMVAERYYNGTTRGSLHDIRSAGKSITSLLVGIAIDQKRIRGVADSLDMYLPEAELAPIGRITIGDLLTMRSGLSADDEDPTSPGNEDRLDASEDPGKLALSIGLNAAPGTRYSYNSLTAYLASLVIERAVGQPADAFASEVLFGPLGINSWRWVRDASGHTKGQGNLFLTAPDLAKIGQMVLDRGVFRGRRVVSEQWIAASLNPSVPISAVDPYADNYGYFWYSRTHRVNGKDILVHFASGNGGNKIYVVPSKEMVVAITSSAYGRGHGQRRSQSILMAVLAAAG
jgi:CubicO group peptidase (beta-lactamase class C family)